MRVTGARTLPSDGVTEIGVAAVCGGWPLVQLLE